MKSLGDKSAKNTGCNICCETSAASCLLYLMNIDSGGRFSEQARVHRLLKCVLSNLVTFLVTSQYTEEMCV